jgi:signal transduction histidine kinase
MLPLSFKLYTLENDSDTIKIDINEQTAMLNKLENDSDTIKTEVNKQTLFINTVNTKLSEIETILKENEENKEYEDLKIHYALHNIKNAAKNMDWTLKSLDIQNFTQQDLEDLNNNIKRIYDTLDDFNKLNNIREQKEFKVQELADIFNKLIRPSVKTKEIKFSFTYQNEDYGDWNVEQNFYDVFQIFNNLIINAEKAMETVSTKELNVLVGDFDGTNLWFYVRDTGIGISEEYRKKVFKESFSTTGGTGIGLMYIRDELKKMGGEIALLESNEQFFTIFEVKIPINLQ